jgi:SAM-dependent methyltransferase
MESNRTTLDTYQKNFDNYVSKTAQETSGSQKDWIESFLTYIDKDTPILEIGAAFGRDAAFITSEGYTNLTVSDAFDVAVDTLKQKGFENVQKLNVLTDEPNEKYGLIIASAVFLHFTSDELQIVLQKLRGNLLDNGVLAFSVKQGEGEEWTNNKMDGPRFFRYWQKDEIGQQVETCGYEIINLGNIDDSQKWLAVTCRPSTNL